MSEPSSQIDREARILLRKWTRCQYYVYIRPLDYRFYDVSADFEVHWKVTVEYRGLDYKQHVAEGNNLSEVIKKLGEEVPIRKPKLAPRASVPRPTERTQIRVKKPGPPIKTTTTLLTKEQRKEAARNAENYQRQRRAKKRARIK